MCEHMNFEGHFKVYRLTDKEDGPVTGYNAQVRIKCIECGHPFIWVGLPYGSLIDAPAISVDGEELRAPIMPSDFALYRMMKKDN